MAFILDDLLLLPIRLPVAGFNWVLKQVQTMANEELLNDQPWKERLIELQMMLEVGDISEEEYSRQEAEVFQALRDIRARREEMARQAAADRGDDDQGGIGIYTGYGKG
ncbi:MAG TPA: gas vesicle protein GvpG [Thermoanaerobaculia bacterium]|nr:gas vesicle protein GvpG [Thermoanaerobaculia bacterium]